MSTQNMRLLQIRIVSWMLVVCEKRQLLPQVVVPFALLLTLLQARGTKAKRRECIEYYAGGTLDTQDKGQIGCQQAVACAGMARPMQVQEVEKLWRVGIRNQEMGGDGKAFFCLGSFSISIQHVVHTL